MGKFLKYCGLSCLLFVLSMSMVQAQSTEGLFGSREFKSTEISAFKKWSSLRVRHDNNLKFNRRNSVKSLYGKCRLSKNFKCVDQEWRDIIISLKNKSTETKLSTINRHLNQTAYITDLVNWQQKDYWATLKQFFNKDGDCEDYAIAKYYSLKELGIPADQMRIVIVEDTNLNVAHAVLAVYLEDQIWILDNQISNIIAQDKIVHYTPLYSINENAWWLHKTS
ncbi:MAG: hypothetical protein HOJ34_00550 [Kordiimonadaceae bacterium]|jgi:predicted transglutaminase-like cysteine proteinase|nr:hypothetical protein [Kordiimonadaceae bacterium]MBT6035013.1 hypothetical protein [Kordiimonadaceae bacterium]MBT6328244.1 hypothetical protein [Kordiimonadaceae bacterium]MBT7582686.1 hypothetical protein [Kordiimonadaceae bacterium]